MTSKPNSSTNTTLDVASNLFDDVLEREVLDFLSSQQNFADLSDAERIIRSKFSLYPRWSYVESSHRTLRRELRILEKNHKLAFIFQFHGDGRIREAALKRMSGPIDTPLAFYGLVLRLNDWVEVVRMEAIQAFERCYPTTPAEAIIPVIWPLILNARSWTRWSNGYSNLIHTIMQRQDVAEIVIKHIIFHREKGTGKVLRALSESEKLDKHLESIALKAQEPHVRAMALNYISNCRATWPQNRTKKTWIDKSMGRYRLSKEFASRQISIKFDIQTILLCSLEDHSVIVQKEALDAIILHRKILKFDNILSNKISKLEKTTNPGVRLRLDYLKKSM